jgi:hypothetical protein
MMIGVPPQSRVMLGADRSTRCFLGRADAASAVPSANTTARARLETFRDGTRMLDDIGIAEAHRE